jgi:DNA-binding NtrC family response regulator
VDVRLIAATNKDLEEEVRAGRFREDLLYRLQVLPIRLPPLRERIGDVPLLVEHLLERISKERGRPVPRLGRGVMEVLEKYRWPGNVRQLENVLHRLVVLAGDGPIDLALIESDDALRRSLLGVEKEAEPLLSLERTEREQIRRALALSGGNRERAARLLGISRATMYRKIKEYELG